MHDDQRGAAVCPIRLRHLGWPDALAGEDGELGAVTWVLVCGHGAPGTVIRRVSPPVC
jgi:hypothetical protein